MQPRWLGVKSCLIAQAQFCLNLLSLYIGPSLAENTTAVTLLRLYSAYVLLLAWNGSTEAFLNATMSTDEVSRHNKRLILFSIIFLAANGLMVPWLGVHGFVLANCINMISRISYSCWYIWKFVQFQQGQSSQEQEPTTSERQINAFSAPLKSFSPLLRLMLPSLKESFTLT
ncbi:Protein RFT1 protein, partial [Fasciola gigantica]